MKKTLPTRFSLLTILLAAALFVPVFCSADEEPVWRDPVMVERDDGVLVLLTPEESGEYLKKQQEKAAAKQGKPKPDPGWIGDCYYYADGGYYH